jgi:hypothetical protein
MKPLFLTLLVLGGTASQGPIFKKDAAEGLKVQKSKTDDSKLYVSLELCKMVEDCGSLDVGKNAIKLWIDSEDGKVKFENPQRIKNHTYQFSIDKMPCFDRRPSCAA